MEKIHSLCFEKDVLTINGVVQVVEVEEKQGVFKLQQNTLVVKGSGLNICKLDKEQGIVLLEVKSLASLSYKQNGVNFKGLFK